jgi:glycosyltransferase involved in cell wall biosynthesis
MDQDLISVNIIARNAEKTLAKTLASVASQSNVNFEIIFVNDESTDATLLIIETFKKEHPHISCTIISNQINLGIAKTRNIALEHSNGNYIAVLDSDDVWIDSMKLSEQLTTLTNDSDIIAVGTQMNIVDITGNIIKKTNYKNTDSAIRKKLLIQNQIAHSSVLFKKTNLRYDESLYIWEDYDFFLRLGQQGKFLNINKVMVNYLYNPKKYSFEQKLKLNQTELEIIKRYKNIYQNFWIGYCKYWIKKLLILLHLK